MEQKMMRPEPPCSVEPVVDCSDWGYHPAGNPQPPTDEGHLLVDIGFRNASSIEARISCVIVTLHVSSGGVFSRCRLPHAHADGSRRKAKSSSSHHQSRPAHGR